ncbi:hypothetical protein EVJ58_g9777 [Rhodofomes roseus]|uniref:Uncharacterized protein n=1 Tax=Rhodofomes roseus TaxID=34475 RepID=A0A4Y9XSW5_9APHY|nr:hypothetical protein EVJ58_g9777 [Rhodofomes roseus]
MQNSYPWHGYATHVVPKALSERISRAARKGNYEIYHPSRRERNDVDEDDSNVIAIDIILAPTPRRRRQASGRVDTSIPPKESCRTSPEQHLLYLQKKADVAEALAETRRAELAAARAASAAAAETKASLIERLSGETPIVPTALKPIFLSDFRKKSTADKVEILCKRLLAVQKRLQPLYRHRNRLYARLPLLDNLDDFGRRFNWVLTNIEEEGTTWSAVELNDICSVCELIAKISFINLSQNFGRIIKDVGDLYKNNYLYWVDKRL